MTATLNRSKTPTRVSLAEIAFSGESKVDTVAGVIRGVKVLGLESQNTGRTIGLDRRQFGDAIDKPYAYALEALRAAVPMYEGLGVYVDHPEFKYDQSGRRSIVPRDRKTAERFGRLVNVRVTESGMYADLEYLKSHPLAAQVAEAAERMPEQFCLSHNAGGKPELRNGRIVITEIADVRSVDIVGERGGTNRGLFESAAAEKGTAVKITLKQLFEAIDPKATSKPMLAKLLEFDPAMGDSPVDYPGEAAPTADAPASESSVKDALKQAVLEALDKADSAKWQAVFAALGMSDSVADLAAGKKTDAATTETVARLESEVKHLAAENESIKLLESAGVPSDAAKLKALVSLPTTADRQALVATWPKSVASASSIFGAGATRPRSTLLESRDARSEVTAPKDVKGFAALVR